MCTVHSPTDSLAQPSCTLVYIVCNPAPRGSPFELSLGLCSKLPSPIRPLRVCVCWFLVFWPWVASLELKSNHLTCPSHTRSSSLIRQLYPDFRVKELHLHRFMFINGQPLVPCSVTHFGLSISSHHYPYILYTSPGSCLVSVGWLPFKRGSKPHGD